MASPLFKSAPLIGKALLEQGFITPQQLEQLLSTQLIHKQRIGEAAVTSGFITDFDLAKFLANFYNLPYIDLAGEEELDPSLSDMISEDMARRYHMLAIKKENDCLTVVMADPLDVRAIDAVRLETRSIIRKAVSSRSAILKAINRHYCAPSRLAKSMDNLLAVQMTSEDGWQTGSFDGANSLLDQLKHEASDAPVIQFVNLLLMRAVQERASDIHIEPEENSVTVRLRVDSQLREMNAPSKNMLQGIITRIKLLSNLDIAERRLPQDGRFKFSVYEKTIDVRVSCLPTVYGEKIVLRILDRATLILDMKELGFDQNMLENFQRVIHLPYGLVILTGPTGSGKTTTLYAALNTIKSPTKNIITIEDPVEYQLAKINQVNTKAEIGLTFAAGLRSILRQDPDVIMVGEVRDYDTAEIAIRAALTGHLVLSTLHTNDAISAVSRLMDMGIEPYLLSATLNLVMAQRLVRRICDGCGEPWNPSRELLDRLSKIAPVDRKVWNFRVGRGCARCGGTGYKGRIAIYEQFVVDGDMKSHIAEGASIGKIQENAKKAGFQTLLQNSLTKVKEGITTLDEAFSVCGSQCEMME